MKIKYWPDEEVAEFDELCASAERAAKSTGARSKVFSRLIRAAASEDRWFAKDVEREALSRGLLSIFKWWQKNRKPRVPVAHDGQILLKPRIIGAERKDSAGKIYHQQTLFDYMTWDELREKRNWYLTQIQAYTSDVAVVDKLLALAVLAPEAATPAEACQRLNQSIEDYLAEAV